MNLRQLFVLICCVSVAAVLQAAEMQAEHKIVTNETLQWTDTKGLPDAKMAVIVGNPSQEGLFTIRLSVPAGLKVLPHWHPADEHLTVLSGAMNMGMGDTFDTNTGKIVPAGAYSFMPAKMHHYVWFKEASIIQITGLGPWKIVYINPEDDPANQKK